MSSAGVAARDCAACAVGSFAGAVGAAVTEAAEALHAQLNAAGIDTVLDDRGLRPGAMFADIELIGIPHRVVVSGRGLEAGSFEYRARHATEAENLDRETLLRKLMA